METLISNTCVFQFKSLAISSSSHQFKFQCSSPKTLLVKQAPARKWDLISRNFVFFPVHASSSINYGGWDDFALVEDSNEAGKFDQLRNLMVSVGIDDRKHVILFVLGFVSALAISRIRVSSVLVFPGSVLVFAVGFLLGFVRSGDVGMLMTSVVGIEGVKGYKGESIRVYEEKLKELGEFFDELDVKIANFGNEIKGSIESDQTQIVALESFRKIIKDINFEVLQAKRLVDSAYSNASMVDIVGDEEDRNMNQKLNRKRRDSGGRSYDIFQLLTSFFQGNSIGMRPNKSKNVAKQELVETKSIKMVNSHNNGDVLVAEGKALNPISNKVVGNKEIDFSQQDASAYPVKNQDDAEVLEGFQGIASSNSLKNSNNANDELRFNDNVLRNPLDFGTNINGRQYKIKSFTTKSKFSFEQQKTSRMSNGAFVASNNRGTKGEKNGSYRGDLKEPREKSENLANNMHAQQSKMEEDDDASASSTVSEDIVFDKHVTEATDLLRQAQECLKGEVDEAKADVLLYKSARILSKAMAMKPMSLLAVGQLGNTFLLHGELKLRISRNLRGFLSRTDPFSRENDYKMQVLKGLDDRVMSKDAVASTLVDVCEECEELLVAAGRKYRTALSIDGDDVRALYNWGLALYYRAQLLADIGPGAAFDADKVYLAAIDKFDAMMSKSNVYAPDALFRWGVTLQQRSRLRPSNSKEKMKLLYQAKRLFEDVLSMDSDNLQVREALLSCMSELNYTRF